MNKRLETLVDSYVEKSKKLDVPLDKYDGLSKQASALRAKLENIVFDMMNLNEECKACYTEMETAFDELSDIIREIDKADESEISDSELDNVFDLWNADFDVLDNGIDDLKHHIKASKELYSFIGDDLVRDFYLNK